MIQPWLAEVVLFPYHFEPKGWLRCEEDRVMLIEKNTALFSLLEHRFGDSGHQGRRFKLPDYDEQAPEGLSYYIAIEGSYPRGELSWRPRGVGEVAILAFEPENVESSPWKRRQPSPALPGATFVVAKSGEPAPPDPFIGEVRLLETTTPPPSWVRCDGQKVRITEAQALYSLVGTKFGGDGRQDFAVPDLRSLEPAGARYFMPVQGVYPPRD